MTTYPTTMAFAYNEPGETKTYCVSCTKEKSDNPLDNGYMMIEYDNSLSFIRCDECGTILKDINSN